MKSPVNETVAAHLVLEGLVKCTFIAWTLVGMLAVLVLVLAVLVVLARRPAVLVTMWRLVCELG